MLRPYRENVRRRVEQRLRFRSLIGTVEETGRIHAKRCGKWVGDYLAKYLSKEIRAGCLKGKRLWAGFGNATWCRVKDIRVQSWLGEEYWRLRGDALEVSREQSYGILQEALVNYSRWVNRAQGIEVWVPATLPECALGIPY